MTAEINRINQVLPNTPAKKKTKEIHKWINPVFDYLKFYKFAHRGYVKDGITLLELAVWKANLEEKEADQFEREERRVTRGGRKRARKEILLTSGADVIIRNVFPFLKLE